MEPGQTTSWQCPPFVAPAEERMAWVEEQIQESEGWLQGQKAYKDLDANMRVFDAIFNDKTTSTLVSNGLKYDVRKFISTLSQVREIGVYGSDAPQYKGYAEIENRMAKYAYLKGNYPDAMKKVLQYATVTGMGYIHPVCKAMRYGWGEKNIVFKVKGILDVMPIQMDETNDVANAYANTIYEYMPIAEAHARYPAAQAQLEPVARRSYNSRVQAKRLTHAEMYRYGMSNEPVRNWGNLFVELRHTFILDVSVNRYGKELPMGDPGTSWFYKVPYLGQLIPAGYQNGSLKYRPARPEDCLIYPYLRLITTSYGMKTPMYDGPGYDWHGEMPLAQYTTEHWAWEPIGRSMVGDLSSIETTIRKIERKIDAVVTVTLNPPLGYDRTSAGGPNVENFNMFEENVRVGLDGKPDDILQSILPDSVKIDSSHFQFLEYLTALRGKQSGLEDASNLENLKMNIAGDTAQQLLEGIGPIGQEIAMGIEKGNGRVAELLKTMIPQWYDTKRIISVAGVDKTASLIFDYDPNNLIPSHMPEEYTVHTDHEESVLIWHAPDQASAYPLIERARRFAREIRVISVPNTLLEVTAMQEQLKYLQLQQKGFPLSFHTVAKKLNIENFGEIDGTTEFEKWVNEQKIMVAIKAAIAQLAQQLMPQPPPDDQGDGGGKGSAKAGGRPSSNKKPPRLEQKGKKDGAPRTTITNS